MEVNGNDVIFQMELALGRTILDGIKTVNKIDRLINWRAIFRCQYMQTSI